MIPEKFWGKVKIKAEGCWEWVGPVDKNGYGIFIGKRSEKRVRAHRLAYKLVKGEIPEGMLVCHSCDNPSCCNPSHLWLGTNRENIIDAVNKGRVSPPHNKGSADGNSTLTEEQIVEIRRASGVTQRSLAKKYGVSNQTICNIINGRSWKHVK